METKTQEYRPVPTQEAIISGKVINREAILVHLLTEKRGVSEIYSSILARLKSYGGNINDEEVNRAAKILIELYQVYFEGEIRKQRERIRQKRQKGRGNKKKQEVKIDTELVKTIPLELLAEKDRRQK